MATGNGRKRLPAFIGGFRSGSTLLINLLGLHPEVAPWFETKELAEALRWSRVLADPDLAGVEAALIQPRAPAGFTPAAVAARMHWHVRRTMLQVQGRVPDGKACHERYPLGGDRVLYSLPEAEAALAHWRAAVADLPGVESVRRATATLIGTLGRRQVALAGGVCWINKTPELPRFGDELWRCLGECRIVLVIRNGWEVVCSAHALGWGSVERLARWWKGLIEQSRAVARDGYYLEIRYEDLIRSPAATLDRTLDFFALEPRGQALWQAYRRLGGGSPGPRRGPAAGDPAARAVFDRIAGDLMDALGYV